MTDRKARYYFSGADRRLFFELLHAEGAAGMVNANCVENGSVWTHLEAMPDLPMVMDSGAFQGSKDVARYAGIVQRTAHRFEWVVNLDVIGNQKESDQNHRSLLDLLPIELQQKVLWVYQASCDDMGYLREMATEHRFVGIGGIVPLMRSVPKAEALIASVGDVLAGAGAEAHFLGLGAPYLLTKYGGEAWFRSADSHSWLTGFKSRELFQRDGTRIRALDMGLSLTRKECAANNIRSVLNWLSGESLQMSFNMLHEEEAA